ncbi:unnamed protein product, partial [Adineta steineri]
MEENQNIKSNVTNLEKEESFKNVSQNKTSTDRPATLNTATNDTSHSHNIRRYNIDDDDENNEYILNETNANDI